MKNLTLRLQKLQKFPETKRQRSKSNFEIFREFKILTLVFSKLSFPHNMKLRMLHDE